MKEPWTGGADHVPPANSSTVLALCERGLFWLNRAILICAAIALIASCVILSYSVVSRSLFHAATYWQDEAAVFLLVGSVFLTAAYVQSQRGHIGIEAFVSMLSPFANYVRQIAIDLASLLFCSFFAWKSWTLAHEAYIDGQISNSMWGPPLAFPYSLMAAGMTLLCFQILLQLAVGLAKRPHRQTATINVPAHAERKAI